ncbi:MAG TPA: hypothetical protein VIK32_16575 [Candidatus Limnocylindrales bacterium]
MARVGVPFVEDLLPRLAVGTALLDELPHVSVTLLQRLLLGDALPPQSAPDLAQLVVAEVRFADRERRLAPA